MDTSAGETGKNINHLTVALHGVCFRPVVIYLLFGSNNNFQNIMGII